MKKNLFLISVVALALGACSNDSTVEQANQTVNQPKEIAFSPLALSSTRSGAQSGTFPTTYNMFVAAYQTTPNAGDYFNGTEFVNISGTSTWHGSTSRYWPLAVSTINFLAVTAGPTSTTRVWGVDTSEPADGTADANWAKKVVVTMADNRPAEGIQHDMMWAVGQGSVTQASAGAVLTFPANVAMEFQHTLALVKFTEKVTSTASGNIKLTSITLNDAYYNGTLTVTSTNYASTPAVANTTSVWTDLSTDYDVVVPGWTGGSSALTNTSDYSAVGDGLMIIPPTSSAAFSGFTVAYKIKNPDSETWQDYSYTYTPTTPTDRILSQGYQYTYNITFNLNEIIVAPTVATWQTGTGGDITIQ